MDRLEVGIDKFPTKNIQKKPACTGFYEIGIDIKIEIY